MFESLKVFLINIVAILMMLSKLATLCLLKVKVFLNEGYDVIIFVHGVTNNLSRDSNYIADYIAELYYRSLVALTLLGEKLS